MTPDEINAIADAVAAKIRPAIPLDVALWDIGQIADYLGASKSHVSNRIVSAIDFPAAVRIATSDGHLSHPRWRAAQVVEWVMRHQEAA